MSPLHKKHLGRLVGLFAAIMWLGAACTALVQADRSKVHDDLYGVAGMSGGVGGMSGGVGGMSGGGGADGSVAGDAAGDASDARPADASDTAAPDAPGDGSLLDLRADGSDGG